MPLSLPRAQGNGDSRPPPSPGQTPSPSVAHSINAQHPTSQVVISIDGRVDGP